MKQNMKLLYLHSKRSEAWVTKVQLYTDSKLMASQFGGLYRVRNDRMTAYLDIIRQLAKQFTAITIILKQGNDNRH